MNFRGISVRVNFRQVFLTLAKYQAWYFQEDE